MERFCALAQNAHGSAPVERSLGLNMLRHSRYRRKGVSLASDSCGRNRRDKLLAGRMVFGVRRGSALSRMVRRAHCETIALFCDLRRIKVFYPYARILRRAE